MTVPFGLTMMTPMRDRPALPELSGAKLDPVTQLGMLGGVPCTPMTVRTRSP